MSRSPRSPPRSVGASLILCKLYRALGIPELGALLSCNRDEALIHGFSEEIELTRTQTIMQGAPFCNFRYRHREASQGGLAEPAGAGSAPGAA